MRTIVITILAIGTIVVVLSGCGSDMLLRVYTVEDTVHVSSYSRNVPDLTGSNPLAAVKFFFYPNVSDRTIHLVPEREFVTDVAGQAVYSEMVSPIKDREGALIAMKSGFFVDTVFFPIRPGDTVNVLLRMRRR